VSDLRAMFGPELVAALEALVDERMAAALAAERRDDGPEWLTLAQTAELLDCSVDAVRMRAKRGRLVTRTQGRRVYVSAESVRSLR